MDAFMSDPRASSSSFIIWEVFILIQMTISPLSSTSHRCILKSMVFSSLLSLPLYTSPPPPLPLPHRQVIYLLLWKHILFNQLLILHDDCFMEEDDSRVASVVLKGPQPQ